MTTLPPEDNEPVSDTPGAGSETPATPAAPGEPGTPTTPPTYAAPQPPYGSPQPPQYGAPQYGAPQQPPYGSPQQPQQPQYGAPQPPQYGAGGYGAPQQPGYGAPGYGGPQQPGYGAPQGYSQPQGSGQEPLSNLTASYWLTVFFLWIPALIFFLIESPRANSQVRALHAANLNFSLLRTALLLFGWILLPLPLIGPGILGLAHLAGFVLHIIAATRVTETYRSGGRDPFFFNAPMVR